MPSRESRRARLLRRRAFLKRALAGGAGVALLGAGFWKLQPRREQLTGVGGGKRGALASPKTAVIVGGGLAGLAAGIELARRKFQVTLLERAPQLGGKLGGWTVNALGEDFPIDAGAHLFLPQAYNLFALLDEAGATRDLEALEGITVLGADGTRVLAGTRVFPFEAAPLLRAAGVPVSAWPGAISFLSRLARYEPRTAASLAGTAFGELLNRDGVPASLRINLLEPLLRQSFDVPALLAADEALRHLHFLLFGNPEPISPRVLTRNSRDAVVDPLRRLFESLGGTVRTGSLAQRILREGNAVSRVVLDEGPPPGMHTLLAAEKVPARGYLRLDLEDGTPLYLARREGRFIAFDARCTHMGCTIEPDTESDTDAFRCPCHGGRYDREGEVTRGPPEHALRRVPVAEHDDGQLSIGEDASAGQTQLACDHCIVACEARGAARLLKESALAEPAFEASVAAVASAPPYGVLRLWLDKPALRERPRFSLVARPGMLDAVAVLSSFQQVSRSWARRTGGSVLELRAVALPGELARDALADALLAELKTAMPELAEAKVLHRELVQQSDFARWPPNAPPRPGTLTPIPNLVLAGDWVETGAPATQMEAAVISGKRAANAILVREGLAEAEIDSIPARGPLG